MSSVGIPRAQGREQRQDLQCLRSITRRYNEQIGVQQNRTNFSREAKNPETPFRTALKEDMLIGNLRWGASEPEILYKGYWKVRHLLERCFLGAVVVIERIGADIQFLGASGKNLKRAGQSHPV